MNVFVGLENKTFFFLGNEHLWLVVLLKDLKVFQRTFKLCIKKIKNTSAQATCSYSSKYPKMHRD